MRERFIPENSEEITRAGIKAVVYTYSCRHGKPTAVGYSGKRMKNDFHWQYQTEEARDSRIEKFFDALEVKAKEKQEYRDKDKQKKEELLESIKSGQIFYSSWGYDQTNIDWYEVLSVKGSTVTFTKLKSTPKIEDSFMSCMVEPTKERVGEPFKKVLRSQYIKLSSYSSMYPWDGTPKRCSWYA